MIATSRQKLRSISSSLAETTSVIFSICLTTCTIFSSLSSRKVNDIRLIPGERVLHTVMVSTLYILRRINMEILFSTPGRFCM